MARLGSRRTFFGLGMGLVVQLVDPEDPPRGRQGLPQATTVTGREGASWEALYTALYWAQGSPNGPDSPEPMEAWVMQAKAMRNYHLHHPFDDSPPTLPWPTDPRRPCRSSPTSRATA